MTTSSSTGGTSSRNARSSAQPLHARRQDYLLRIRYHNSLPPPPFQSKMLDIPFSPRMYTDTRLLDNLVLERSNNLEVDQFLGMPVDLSDHLPLFIGDENQRNNYMRVRRDASSSDLDPKDQVILSNTKNAAIEPSRVSFLRRTEYISSENARSNVKTGSKASSSQVELIKSVEERGKALEDVEKQADEIEHYFEMSQADISTLRHPNKPDVRAVKALPLLPDLSNSSSTLLLFKYMQEHLRRPTESSDDTQDTALFLPSVAAMTGEEYFKCFSTDRETAKRLEKRSEDLDESSEHVENDASDDVFRFEFAGNLEGRLQTNGSQYEELALVEDTRAESGEALYFTGIAAKANLRQMRIAKNSKAMEDEIDAVDLRIRSEARAESGLNAEVEPEAEAEADPEAELNAEPEASVEISPEASTDVSTEPISSSKAEQKSDVDVEMS